MAQVLGQDLHSSDIDGAAYVGFGGYVVVDQTAQHVYRPQVGVIGLYLTRGLKELAHGAVQTLVVQKLALGECQVITGYGHYGVVHEHIGQQRTQFLAGFVAAGEKLLIESGAYVACQADGLVQMVADCVAYHLGGPVVQRRVGLIGREAETDVEPVGPPVRYVSLGQESVAQGLVLLYLKGVEQRTE